MVNTVGHEIISNGVLHITSDAKVAAHVNSSARDILNTLQKRKKWTITNEIAKAIQASTKQRPIVAATPTRSTAASNLEKRKPGENCGESLCNG